MTASKWLSRVRRPIRVPGGVADPDGGCVYLEAVDGGIEAVDLESGAALWKTDAASIPVLGLRGGLLAAGLA
ncbi:MAG TPA: hypothetical protein VJ997_13870, partial [Longimicrobiales bacterium]|nr:hypothetical protein [Longimicrobiales bacterium]